MQQADRSLASLANYVYDCTDIHEAAEEICRYIVNELGHFGSAIYLNDRLAGVQTIISSAGNVIFPVEPDHKNHYFDIFPSYRNDFVCGSLVVTSPTTRSNEQLKNLSKIIVLLSERKYILDIFNRASRPIDFRQDEEDFFSDLKDLARESSQMPAGAMRVSDGERFKTIFAWNDWTNERAAPTDWDILFEEAPLPFIRAFSENEVVVLQPTDTRSKFFQRPTQRGIEAAIFCPINVGNEVIGVLSFALPVPYDFPIIEKRGFLNLANSIGVSLTNFENTAFAELNLHDDVKVSQILTSVEIAQSARHSAKADLDTLKVYVSTLRRLVNGNIDRNIKEKIQSTIQECDISISSCFKSLDDIKSAVRPPVREAKLCSIESLFDRARTQIRGRIIKYNVDVKWTGQDVQIECFPDYLTQVFLNLILNSVDAFSAQSRKNQRSVMCRLHNYHVNSEKVMVRFEDNAGGVDVAALKSATSESDLSVEELVFKKGVTTKAKDGTGAGWGLHLSRKIINDHGGHLSLLEYRGKMVFEIELGKRMTL